MKRRLSSSAKKSPAKKQRTRTPKASAEKKAKKKVPLTTPDHKKDSALGRGIRDAAKAAVAEPQVAKGNPLYPTLFLAMLFDEGVADLQIQKNATIMEPLCAFVAAYLDEEDVKVPTHKKRSRIRVGQVRMPIPYLPDDASFDLDEDVRTGLVAGLQAMCRAFIRASKE